MVTAHDALRHKSSSHNISVAKVNRSPVGRESNWLRKVFDELGQCQQFVWEDPDAIRMVGERLVIAICDAYMKPFKSPVIKILKLCKA
jgi:hypothetical protein